MKGNGIRITGFKIENLKNVESGTLTIDSDSSIYSASILGLYGQNGSGKTALVDAFQILKFLLSGLSLPRDVASYIRQGSDHLGITVSFISTGENGTYLADYYTCIGRKIPDESVELGVVENGVCILEEKLSYSYKGQLDDSRKEVLIFLQNNSDYKGPIFKPKSKEKELLGIDGAVKHQALIAKEICSREARSFIFSNELAKIVSDNLMKDSEDKKLRKHAKLLSNLREFGLGGLFVIDTRNTGLISLNMQPIRFIYHSKADNSAHYTTTGQIHIPLDEPIVIPNKPYQDLLKIFEQMNIVLKEIIPGLEIEVKDLGPEAITDEIEGRRIQLMSSKTEGSRKIKIPLKYESEGIQKIISILHLLIEAFNSAKTTVVIDELDSGIFEYLLGNLLKIFAEKGKGQLIFTSHNLRPLETIDSDFIGFTTMNSADKYVKIPNIKINNNLRDVYFRKVSIGDDKYDFYHSENNSKIAMAMKRAGKSK